MGELRELIEDVVRFRDERAWRQFHTPRQLAAALAIEAGELQETMLWKSDGQVEEALSDPSALSALRNEIGDVFIYGLLLCHATNTDPADAVRTKLAENAAKYPVHLSKGNAEKYDRLARPSHVSSSNPLKAK